MTWAQRLKRVFKIDIETCNECGGAVKIIASIEDPEVIKKILAYLDKKAVSAAPISLPECRAPPSAGSLEGLQASPCHTLAASGHAARSLAAGWQERARNRAAPATDSVTGGKNQWL